MLFTFESITATSHFRRLDATVYLEILSLSPARTIVDAQDLAFVLRQKDVSRITRGQHGKKFDQPLLADRGRREVERPADDDVGEVKTIETT